MLQGTRQGLVHVPRFPLRPPAQLDNRQRPETEKQSAPCTKTSVFTPGTFDAAAISSRVISRARTTRFAPNCGCGGHVGGVGHAGLRADM